jgi:hypothetical protein
MTRRVEVVSAGLDRVWARFRLHTEPLPEPVVLDKWINWPGGTRTISPKGSGQVVGFARSDAEEAAENERLLQRGCVLGGGVSDCWQVIQYLEEGSGTKWHLRDKCGRRWKSPDEVAKPGEPG